MRLVRLFYIVYIIFRFGLDEFLRPQTRGQWLTWTLRGVFFWRHFTQPRAERLRLALESLGPIFVKFGQMLSTRRDLLPPEIADELAKLQDRVPPFAREQVLQALQGAYGIQAEAVFSEFDWTPVASASVAQVHFARLPDGTPVAVKILRPNIAPIIQHDLALLEVAASLLARGLRDGKRLRPREVVAEFRKHLQDELDLTREAANASQLRRNFINSHLLRVPEIYWDWCHDKVMVMERMHGIPISQFDHLRAANVDIPRLARAGVEIFFTQVFRDGFFHADMHPGNILVDPQDGRYIALDFGIMGTLTAIDKHYLAVNFLAFFQRDYKRVAEAHIESGWAPKDVRIDEFEAAIRAVCEPIFDKPLKDISFGKVLLRLFQTSRRFNVQIQPQLVLLQKTLLNIEGLGRQLDPNLDLWKTAKPFLERWMQEQVGWRGLWRNLKQEAPLWAGLLPTLPRLTHQLLSQPQHELLIAGYRELMRTQKQRNAWLALIACLLAGLLGWLLLQTL